MFFADSWDIKFHHLRINFYKMLTIELVALRPWIFWYVNGKPRSLTDFGGLFCFYQSPVLLPEAFGESFRPPKKRAETWVQDETKALIAFRKEMDALFNTSKSNKHLWEQISQKMKDRGYDRSPTMCTDKWRNLLKEYKKAKTHDRGSSKIACFKDLEDLLGDRAKLCTPYRSLTKADQSPKGTETYSLRRETLVSAVLLESFDTNFTDHIVIRKIQKGSKFYITRLNEKNCVCPWQPK